MTTSSSVPGPLLPAWLRRLTGGSGPPGTGAGGHGEDPDEGHRRAGPVVAVGDGELTDHVACWAEQLAHRTGRDLRLVVAVAARPTDDRRPVSRGAAVLVRQRLDRVADDVAVRSGEVDVEAEVRIGRWADVVADEVRDAAVVVVPPGARPVRPSPVVRSAPVPRLRPPPGGVPHRLTAADAGPGALPTA
jgi:hypothetical protein